METVSTMDTEKNMNEALDEILSLLRSKNRCLERLQTSTHAFIASPIEQIAEKADQAKKNPLESYERERASALKALELYDRKVNQAISALPSDKLSAEFQIHAKAELAKNESLILAALQDDDTVFAKIEEARTRLAQLMNENRKSREILSKFKSAKGVNPAGEEVDQEL